MNYTPFFGIQAVFLDRDGVINCERRDYVKSWEEFEFLPGALAALQRLAAYPWPIVIITNQSAINRNLVSADEVMTIHHKLSEYVLAAGGRIDAIFTCPHRPDEQCACRKPQPGLLIRAAQAFQLDLPQCLLIGDSWTDYQAASAVNCPAILVESRYENAPRTLNGQSRITILPDLLSAVSTIIDSPLEQSKVEK